MERTPSRPGSVGLILPTLPQGTSPGRDDSPDPLTSLVDVCSAAEELGADALWACDHLFWHGPVLECLSVLAVAATATRRAALGSCVLQLPLRQAPAVAKQAATLQTLSGGRLVLGVGVGSHAGEYEQAELDFHRRGHLLDAGIAELQRSWASGPGPERGAVAPDATVADRYRQLPDAPAVPVWVGGSSEAALCRAATLGDGWMPLFLGPEEYRAAVERLAKEAAAAGRDPEAVLPAMVLFVSVDDDPVAARERGTAWMSGLYGLPARAFARHLVSGPVNEVATAVADYRRAGARHIALYVTDDRPLGQFERLRGALPTAVSA